MLNALTKDAPCDLSAFEWKKRDVNDKQLVLQQSKDIRSDKCDLAIRFRHRVIATGQERTCFQN